MNCLNGLSLTYETHLQITKILRTVETGGSVVDEIISKLLPQDTLYNQDDNSHGNMKLEITSFYFIFKFVWILNWKSKLFLVCEIHKFGGLL